MSDHYVSATSGELFELVAPLAGWLTPLSQVPDSVFAGGMAGDGVAIDPVGESLHAPCDGVIALMGSNRHALTLKSRAGDVLLHVGIDTVKLEGGSFELSVRDGEAVVRGQLLMNFDLDVVVRGASSAVSPVLLMGQAAGRIVRRQSPGRVAVGDFLYAATIMEVAPHAASHVAQPVLATATRLFRVPFEHGLHARPAAQVAAVLSDLDAEVLLTVRGGQANARSVVAMMALGATHGETIAATAAGRQAQAALVALSGLLESICEPAPAPGPESFWAPANLKALLPGASLPGLVAARGIAVGVAAPLVDRDLPIGEALGDSGAERARLLAAIDAVTVFLKKLAASRYGAQRGVLDAHLALLSDPELLREAQNRLNGGASAGLAWRSALRSAADALAALQNPRMAERRADLLDIERQVVRALAGVSLSSDAHLPDRAVVLAAELLPSQLLSLDSARVAAICTAGGGATSHLAILAASMGLPTLVAAGPAVLAIPAGTPLIVDADAGVLLVDPPAAERQRLEELEMTRARERILDNAAAHQPAVMRDGTKIDVYCNLGAAEEALSAVHSGAEGCGLLRTEFLFQARQRAPNEEEQLAQYQAIANALCGRPLTIRILDAGGDKSIPYLVLPREDNPALGLRGLRTMLAHPELLTTQLRSILRVTPTGQCRVLLPMVTDLDDLRGVRAEMAAIAAEFRVKAPALGVMIETPSSALLADQLAGQCDFLAIGSNDLSQYTLAMDRMHPSLASRLDALHPAVLRLIDRAFEASRDRGIEAGVCGAMASDPQAIPVLIGLGVRELSVVPAQIPRVKSLLRTLDPESCTALARQALLLPDARAVRSLVRDWSGNA